MTCDTQQPPKFSCANALREAVAAYHQLMVGAQKVMVRHGESEVRYEARNLSALKQHILSLHQSCPCAESAAMLGIPQNRRPGTPVYANQRYTEVDCGCGPTASGVQQHSRNC